jgi:hypothetical protein
MKQAKVYVGTSGKPRLDEVQRYLYNNFKARYAIVNGDRHIVIEGDDWAGFTIQAIIDRLQSGLIWAGETTAEDTIVPEPFHKHTVGCEHDPGEGHSASGIARND